MTVLAQIATNPARSVLVVAHDPRIIPFANRIIRIEDGPKTSESDSSLPHEQDIPRLEDR
jgi:putative ABC transport system ATP-binding protein